MSIRRRHVIAAAGGFSLCMGVARAQPLPDSAKIYAGFAPGGTVDVTARRIADKLRDVVAKSVVVENRTGAGGQIALSALKLRAPGRGITERSAQKKLPPPSTGRCRQAC